MNTKEGLPAGRRRRRHSAEFKAKVVEECRAGVSMAAVALAHGLNPCLRVHQPAWQSHQSPGARWAGHLAVRSASAPRPLRVAEGPSLDANDAHALAVRRIGDRTAVGAYRRAKRDCLGVNQLRARCACPYAAIAFQYTERQYVEK